MTSSKRNDLYGMRPAAAPAPARRAAAAGGWQRWQMGALENAAAQLAPPATPAAPTMSPAAEWRVDEAELQQLREAAREAGLAAGRRDGWNEGHEAGFAQGRAAGHAQGLADTGAQARQLQALCASLPQALRLAEAELADAVLALALDVARQVVHRTLTAEPQWLLPLVRDVLREDTALQGTPQLLLQPDDLALVREQLGAELDSAGWQLRADPTLTRGGCRVLCASGELDATLETRWARVQDTLRPAAGETP